MSARIAQLKIKGFRGASQPLVVEFDHTKATTVIFGENGTGKSTLVDAIDAVANESLGSIDNRGLGSASHQYLHSLSTSTQLEIELLTNAGYSWKATVGRRVTTQPVGNHKEARPIVQVLRRSQLLKLLEDRPADRYAAMKHFLEVEAVEASEAALRSYNASLQNEWEQAEKDRNKAEQQLHDTWEHKKLSDDLATTALEWAKSRQQEDMQLLNSRAQHLTAIDTLLTGLEEDAKLIVKHGVDWREAKRKNQEAQDLIRSLPNADINSTALVTVLQNTLQYFDSLSVKKDVCPVCTNRADNTILRSQLVGRLHDLQSTVTLIEQAHKTDEYYKLADTRLRETGDALSHKLSKIKELLDKDEPKALSSCATMWTTYQMALPTDAEPHQKTISAYQLAVQLHNCISLLRAEIEHITSSFKLIDTLNSQVYNHETATQKLLEIGSLRQRIKRTIEIIENQRKLFTQRILDSITTEVNRLYSIIHPDENVGLERLEIDPNRRGSLNQRVNFAGHTSDVPPQAYFSESHLDTLGFCLWMALAKRQEASNTIIVLDDVFTSVDFEHFQRITDLLDVEAGSFRQLIIATHSRRWYDRYQRRRDNAHLLRLESWSLTKGVQVFSEKTHIAKLEYSLCAVPCDRHNAALQAGIMLEELLQRIGIIYECWLPFREVPGFSLNELLRGTTGVLKVAKVTRYKKQEDTSTSSNIMLIPSIEIINIEPLFKKVNRHSSLARNAGAHYSISGLDIPDNELESFASDALLLAKALICPICCEIPSKKKNGSFLACICKINKMELTPFARP